MITQIVVGILGLVVGYMVLWQNRNIVNFFGNIPAAEKYLGSAGTYLLIRMSAIVGMVCSFLYIFGWLEPFGIFLKNGILGFFGVGN